MDIRSNITETNPELLQTPDSVEEWIATLPEEEQGDMLEVDSLLTTMAERNNHPAPSPDEAWEKWRSENIKPQRRSIPFYIYASCAAVAVTLIILTFSFFFKPAVPASNELIALSPVEPTTDVLVKTTKETINSLGKVKYVSFAKEAEEQNDLTVVVPRGQNCTIMLPDSTEVCLNAESQISFPSKFTGDTRRVKLTGEAFFKVHHDASHPFIVSVNNMDVTVLGTEFNVKGYEQNQPTVTLVKGSVKLSSSTQTGSEMLKPGEVGTLASDGHIAVGEADVYATTQWMQNIFYFNNASLVDVLCELGRWYNLGVKVKSKHPQKENIHFSADRNDNLKNAIDNLNQIQNTLVTIENNYIVIH